MGGRGRSESVPFHEGDQSDADPYQRHPIERALSTGSDPWTRESDPDGWREKKKEGSGFLGRISLQGTDAGKGSGGE